MMRLFHPDKAEVRFQKQDRPLLEEFSKTILRITKENLTDENWKAEGARIRRQMNHVRHFAQDYEDWSMQCDLLSAFQEEELANKREEALQEKGYGRFKECTTLEQFKAVYMSGGASK